MGDGHIVTLQGHPEFSTDPGFQSIMAIADCHEKLPEYEEGWKENFLKHVQNTPTDSEVLIKVLTQFLSSPR